jgi:3-hydroxybutyryl-CoA dehydrogenase
MAYPLPNDVDARPITIVGAGTLGRRIAAMYAAGGSEVRIVDPAEVQRASARDFVSANAEDIRRRLRLRADRVGAVETVSDLVEAVPGAWMVIETVPERLDLKREVFGELDRLADPDAILGSNSSSLPSSSFIENVDHAERVLNTHYRMPPDLNAVELMSDGRTDPAVIDGLMSRLPLYGFVPFHVRRDTSTIVPTPV